jgi:hypothetical protein
MNEEFEKLNTSRILKNGHLHLANLIKMGRYTEAAELSNKLCGILKLKASKIEAGREATMKRSNPAITFTSQVCNERIWKANKKLS